MRSMRHLSDRREHFLRNYLRRLGSRGRKSTSPTQSNADPQETSPPPQPKSRYVPPLTSRERLRLLDPRLYSLSVTLHLEPSRGVLGSPSIGARSFHSGPIYVCFLHFTLRLPFVTL